MLAGNSLINPPVAYKPCTFIDEYVSCDKVPLEEIQKIFRRTVFLTLVSVKIILQPRTLNQTTIPEDILGNKRVLELYIEYPSDSVGNHSFTLLVDKNAFRSTKKFTKRIEFRQIDCSLLDLGFLSGFDYLTELKFYSVEKIQNCLLSLPSLRRLTILIFIYCSGMNKLNSLPLLQNGLNVFSLYCPKDTDGMSNDETINRIMDWLLLFLPIL